MAQIEKVIHSGLGRKTVLITVSDYGDGDIQHWHWHWIYPDLTHKSKNDIGCWRVKYKKL